MAEELEIHFLELPKLRKAIKDKNDPVIDWLEFINADSKEVMEMLAKKNKNMSTAFDILQAASKDEKKRLAYEAREAALKDEATRVLEAREEGFEKGIEKGKLEVAIEMIKQGSDVDYASKVSKIPIEILKKYLNDNE